MRTKLPLAVLIAAITLTSLPGPAEARALFDIQNYGDSIVYQKPVEDSLPTKNFNVHSVGKIALMITNFGALGTGYVGSPVIDGRPAPSLEYPINSNLSYLFTGAIWIGAIVGRDTLVSGAADGWSQNTPELWPEMGDAGEIEVRSNLKSSNDYHPDAISEQDFICAFTDTFPDISGYDAFDNRGHIPLNVAVKQSSYAWSYEYAEDFVLFDFRLTNIGNFPLRNLFMGLYIDADVHHRSNSNVGYGDDICGFRRTVGTPPGFCIHEDTINIAYIADNDGDPVGAYPEQNWSFLSPNSVTGIRVVRTPNPDLKYGFNWWVSNGDPALDFGPRTAGTEEDPYRPFGSHLGTPTGDRNKYYILSHPEFDYDQLFTAVSHTGEGFMQPPLPAQAQAIAKGFDTRYLLSFGPFDLNPGDSVPITLAYLGGENFHSHPSNFIEYFDAFNPHLYYQTLSFEDFGLNARWASWVFDNPGYDTDGDGDSGKFCWNYVWVTDTTSKFPNDSIKIDSSKFYYAGDGVPDFRSAAPPPPPKVNVIPGFGEVTLRWNGQESENAIDVFSMEKDFEGYRIYYGRDNRQTDFVRLATYDVEDYRMFEFIIRYDTVFWQQRSAPIRGDSLRALFGENFDPYLYFDEFNYFHDQATDRFYYFLPQDWNHSDLSDPKQIHKVYPEAPLHDPADTTQEGYLRYYEYEYHIPNLQPSVPYYFSVTAFDYGSLKVDLGALETSPLVNAVEEYALPSAETVEDLGMRVIVYPNPYRIDAGYARAGYENRDRTKSAERARVINFANLPRICTIRIYSIDGDLIKELKHYYPEGGPGSQHEVWNLISRNTQAVVTGIYIWHVASDMGEQMGKLVIIK